MSRAGNENPGGKIRVQGLPFDANSSFLKGPAKAPAFIRKAFYSPSANLWTENGLDLGQSGQWCWEPDLALPDADTAFARVENRVTELLERQHRLILLGGDHSLTWPVIRAYARAFPGLNILHLDAHPDLYDHLDGSRHSHACPFARIMEEGLCTRLVQAGIRTLTGHQKDQAECFNVEIFQMKDGGLPGPVAFDGPVYLSVDMDCLDPAFAPGVSHLEPGGLSTREVLSLIRSFNGSLVGADIVEFNPDRDLNGMTAMVAAKLLKQILGRMIETAF